MDLLIRDKGDGGDVVPRDELRDVMVPETITVSQDSAGAVLSVINGVYTLQEGLVEEKNWWALGSSIKIVLVSLFGSSYKWQIQYGGVAYAQSETLTGLDTIGPPDSSVQTWEYVYGSQPYPAPPDVTPGEIKWVETDNADLHTDTGIGTAVYVSLFTGVSWQDQLKTSGEAIDGAGGFEAALNDPITLGSIATIKTRALAQLQWLVTDKVASDLSVEVSNPSVGLIQVDISATEPDSTNNRYKILWNQQEQKLIELARN